MLTFRKATANDSELYLAWVNEPTVRRNSVNSEIVQREHHEMWFNKKLNDPASLLLVAAYDNIPCGQIRLDQVENKNVYEIDYSIDIKFRGMGLAKLILAEGAMLLKERKPAAEVLGKVKEQNLPSVKAFIAAGYVNIASVAENDEKYFIFKK